MKDALKRMLGLSQAPAEAETQHEGAVELTDVKTDAAAAVEGVDTLSLADQVAALQATVGSLTEQIAANASALAEKDSKIAELTALVEAAADFKAAQVQAAAEAKVAARTAKLAEAVGTEQATALQAALASLDDSAFDLAVGAMSNKMKAEESTPAFKEVGVEGSTDTTKLAAEVYGGKTADYLQAIVKNELK